MHAEELGFAVSSCGASIQPIFSPIPARHAALHRCVPLAFGVMHGGNCLAGGTRLESSKLSRLLAPQRRNAAAHAISNALLRGMGADLQRLVSVVVGKGCRLAGERLREHEAHIQTARAPQSFEPRDETLLPGSRFGAIGAK